MTHLPRTDDLAARMTTVAVLEAMAANRARLDRALAELGDGVDTAVVTPEGWTARDLLGHLIHWAGQIAFGLGAPLQPPAYVVGSTGRPTGDEWNALVSAHYRVLPFDDVKATLDATMDALVEGVRLQSDDQMNATASVGGLAAAVAQDRERDLPPLAGSLQGHRTSREPTAAGSRFPTSVSRVQAPRHLAVES